MSDDGKLVPFPGSSRHPGGSKKPTPTNTLEPATPSGRKRHPTRAERVDLEEKALALARQGNTYKQIADALGYRSASGAYEVVKRALDRIPDPNIHGFRKMQLERYQRLLRAWWARAVGADGNPPDVDAVEVVTKLLARLDKLYGLESIKIEHTGPAGGPVEVQVVADVRTFLGIVGDIAVRGLADSNGHGGRKQAAEHPVLPAHPNGETGTVPPDL